VETGLFVNSIIYFIDVMPGQDFLCWYLSPEVLKDLMVYLKKNVGCTQYLFMKIVFNCESVNLDGGGWSGGSSPAFLWICLKLNENV
jgi:hypothetical protein